MGNSKRAETDCEPSGNTDWVRRAIETATSTRPEGVLPPRLETSCRFTYLWEPDELGDGDDDGFIKSLSKRTPLL
eukprot:SAG11_NODE_14732_length_601_cov_3.290837_1_plen_74_part_10